MRIPKPLLDDIKMGKCIPFIGAGFSLNCNAPAGTEIPDWKGLSNILADEAHIDSKKQSPLEIASKYEHNFGRVQLIEAIRNALHADCIEPGDVHKIFASLSFETVYTTNFDLLIEVAFQDIKKPYRSLVGELQIPFHGGPATTNIVKMHGDLRHEEHIIITKEDYDNYLENYPVIATHLSAMLITRTPLFMGYSLSDPNFQHIRDVIRSRLGRFVRMGYIIQFNATQKDIKNQLKQKLHTINLKTTEKKNKGMVLIDFFNKIQTYVESIEATKLRDSVPEAFEPLDKSTLMKSFNSNESSSLLASTSNLCFVIMPFKIGHDLTYKHIIKPVAENFGLTVLRADEIHSPGVITEQIKVAIHQARVCIADITYKNPNVLYELGVAHTLRKPTILMSKIGEQIPFDVAQFRVILYDENNIDIAKDNLSNAIKMILGKKRFTNAEMHLQQGNLRAAVIEASIYLEAALTNMILRTKEISSQEHGGRAKWTMGAMAEILFSYEMITTTDYKILMECNSTRNDVVHSLGKPSILEAEYFIQNVNQFVEKYLPGYYSSE